jgi:hypothetical protein
MKSSALLLITAFFLSSFQNTVLPEDEVELVCVRRHNASNTCHYNFKIEGAEYRYLDIGCKGKKEDMLKKAKEGKLGLAKDWKIICPEAKKQE